jgi:hypothetical protein
MTPAETIKWAAYNCKWRLICRMENSPERFGRQLICRMENSPERFGRQFSIGFLKFTSIPPDGELINRKHFKGFRMTISNPLVYTFYRKLIDINLLFLHLKGEITFIRKIAFDKGWVQRW